MSFLEQIVPFEMYEVYDAYESRVFSESKKELQSRKRPQKKKAEGTEANQPKAHLRKKRLFQMGILNQGEYESRSDK